MVISACYSGGFIPFLEDENTLIMTVEAYNRTSFGCSDDAEITYFGRAFFKESLLESASFEAAFVKAKCLIYEWKKKKLLMTKQSTLNLKFQSQK